MTRQLGFTLVEVLVVVAISAMVGVFLVAMLIQNIQVVSQQTIKTEQGVSLNDALSHINNEVKSAASIKATYPETSPLYTTGSQTLILAMPAVDSNNNVIENVYDYAVITVDASSPKILRKRIFPNPQSSRKSEDRVLLNRVSFVQFTYLNVLGEPVIPTLAAKVNFVLNVAETSAGKEKISSSSGQLNLRNN